MLAILKIKRIQNDKVKVLGDSKSLAGVSTFLEKRKYGAEKSNFCYFTISENIK
jgi:hypothetical protein